MMLAVSLLVILICISASLWQLSIALQEAPDGSVCFNNCNGHGHCVDYSCHCFPGFHGDDCSTSYALNTDHIIPILGAGHFNLTRKNFTQAVVKNKKMLVGFSSLNCHKCIQVENDYENISSTLKELKIPFARADADNLKSIALEHGASDVPSLVWFSNQRPYLYKGSHRAEAVIEYIHKQTRSPVVKLNSELDVNNFLLWRKNSTLSLSTVVVVGFFSDHKEIEEDEYEEFMETAKEYQSKEDMYFGLVTNAKVAKVFKANHTIDRTPSVLLIGDSDVKHTYNLDEMYGDSSGLSDWILKRSVPVVGKLTNANFGLYEKSALPMLILFLDLTNEDLSAEPGRVVGGKSGGILNELLLDEFRVMANEYSDKVNFVYIDGTKHKDQMKSLGLYGGIERLPQLAFNTRDRRRIPFPEELPINRDTINKYCAEFLSGRLKNSQDSIELVQKALQASGPMNTKNTVQRKLPKPPPKPVIGVSEQFGDGAVGDTAVSVVTSETFDEVVMNEDKDVLLLIHAQECESCSHFTVYFKRMADRFRELGINSLVVARMDVTTDAPPAQLNLITSDLPILVLFPAGEKFPPWNYYSGVGKVQPMMKWVQQKAGIPFDLPNLPHLTEDNRQLYKKQVREREEYLDEQRQKDAEAMEEEERKQRKYRESQEQKTSSVKVVREEEYDNDEF